MLAGAQGDDTVIREIAAEIHRYVQANPNSYASRALAALVNREAAGERVPDDERELVLMTILREAKGRAGPRNG